ncbi:MAG: hypothetical protein R2695_01910 [Acidimicrobiales bacterium]
MTALGLAAAVREGRTTAARVLEDHLDRIAARDPSSTPSIW